jgi:hypothetical protein
VIDVAAAAGHPAVVQQHRRAARRPRLEGLGHGGLAPSAAEECLLVLRLVPEREQQPTDVRMGLARSLLAVVLASGVLPQGAGARDAAVDRLLSCRRGSRGCASGRDEAAEAGDRAGLGVPVGAGSRGELGGTMRAAVGSSQREDPRRHAQLFGTG